MLAPAVAALVLLSCAPIALAAGARPAFCAWAPTALGRGATISGASASLWPRHQDRGASARRASRSVTAQAGGQPPSWVPWDGQHGRMVDTERDDLMLRDKCKLCRGGGSMSCRKCYGKGMLQLRSRALRSSSDALNDGESLYCDPKTGLVRAVEMCECPSCQRRGRIRCALCYGTGQRQEESSLKSFRLADGSSAVRVVGDDDSDDPDDILHRYCGGRR
eukprot:Tamp_23886.p1 GENE.Tamp_23886~~Tamp_23886.p1  ORF type:complete len:228 (+),score=21.92 Tamp_23886:25-684(+)